MRTETDLREGEVRVSVEGRVDLDESPRLLAALREVTGRKSPRVVVDLSRVESMDSSGAATLVGALRLARRHGGGLRLVAVPERVRDILRLTGVLSFFTEEGSEGPTTVVTPPERTVVVEAENLAKSFGGRRVLSDVSFSVRTGETLVIMGRSGSGKTTCLRILMGQAVADQGEARLFGKNLALMSRAELSAARRRFGVVFQSGALLNSLTVAENVALPLRELTRLSPEVVSLMVKMKLERVGLRDASELLPDQLSGGMKKRVGIARALIMDPAILFYDEPTAGLDPVMTAVINQLIMEIGRALNVASVVVTHDMESAFKVADHMVMLFEGKVVAEGTPDEVRRSNDPILRQFVDGDHQGPVSYTESSTDFAEDLLGR